MRVLRRGGEGDGVAEGFELANVVALLSVGAEMLGEVIGSQIDETGVVVVSIICSGSSSTDAPAAIR